MQAQLILTPVTSIMCLQGLPHLSCFAVCSTGRLSLHQRCLVATQQQLQSRLSCLQISCDDYFGWVKHFPSLKQIWSWIWNNLRLMNLTMISYVNSFPRIQPWFHNFLHSTEFTHEFMIMNLYMITLSWIHQHELRDKFIHMTSDIWFHDILDDHEFIYEFIYMKNIVKSYLKSCVPRFQMYRAKSKLNWNRPKSSSASKSLLWALILDLS